MKCYFYSAGNFLLWFQFYTIECNSNKQLLLIRKRSELSLTPEGGAAAPPPDPHPAVRSMSGTPYVKICFKSDDLHKSDICCFPFFGQNIWKKKFNRSFKVSNYSLHSDQHNFDHSAFLTPKDLGPEAKNSKKSRKSHFFRTKITVKRPGQVVSTWNFFYKDFRLA
jgi:hypothetical protein